MIAFAPWQALLDALGWVLAQIYDFVPNYGVSIILLTVVIRLILLPLGIKQIRSMQHMQIVQPRIKQIQQKYKTNKQRQQEEIMKLYREYGVNPFSGCWPVLLQFPILIAMYSILRWPQHPIHVPLESELCAAVSQQIPQQIPVCDPNGVPITSQAQIDDLELPGSPEGTSFLATNLLCAAGLPWQEAPNTLPDRVTGQEGETAEIVYPVDCASTALERIPYYVFAAVMFATTFYQQRQMQKASPPGAASSQQQALLKVMPILFGVFGIFFPAGLVLYWTTSNLWQIGQQHFMLKTRPTEEDMAASVRSKPQKAEKRGFMASMMDRAEQERKRREGTPRNPGSRKPGKGNQKSGGSKPSSGPGKPERGPRKPDSGGNGGGDPKKRPKR
ncbi:MAG TPA: YidC/Oxa1 family membrane protein insertase [Actinomycetota bacterium]|nr:YidC/Oxa1 family membrane protein insertase [Actinomycetota bacterium]